MMNCIFCKVIAKEVPGYFILEEENIVAFLDIFGSVPGHVMVVHKRHGYSIQDYSEAELGEIMSGVKIVSKKIENALKTDSISIGINHKEEKGVPHLHIHLIPRFKNDGGKVIQSLAKEPIVEDLDKIADRIRNS
jgi:histidine triad (HIT) family protein